MSDSTTKSINWETCPAHALPAMLQTSLDTLHLQKLNAHSQNVERLNYELKHVLNYVASEFKKHKASKHGEKQYPYSVKPNDDNADPNAPKTMSIIEPGDKLSLTFQKLIAIKSIELPVLTKDQLEKIKIEGL